MRAHESQSVDATAQMWAFFEEEMRIARTGEVYTEEVPVPSGRKHARVVRVGKMMLGFVSEDGVDVGVWVGGTGWTPGSKRPHNWAVRQVSVPLRFLTGNCMAGPNQTVNCMNGTGRTLG